MIVKLIYCVVLCIWVKYNRLQVDRIYRVVTPAGRYKSHLEEDIRFLFLWFVIKLTWQIFIFALASNWNALIYFRYKKYKNINPPPVGDECLHQQNLCVAVLQKDFNRLAENTPVHSWCTHQRTPAWPHRRRARTCSSTRTFPAC